MAVITHNLHKAPWGGKLPFSEAVKNLKIPTLMPFVELNLYSCGTRMLSIDSYQSIKSHDGALLKSRRSIC